MLELLNQLGYSPMEDIHLLMPIEEFVHKKEQEFQKSEVKDKNRWEFIIKPDKSKVWINKFSRVESIRYPYIEELKKEIGKFKKMVHPKLNNMSKQIKTEVNVFDFIYINKEKGKIAIEKVRKEVLQVRLIQ